MSPVHLILRLILLYIIFSILLGLIPYNTDFKNDPYGDVIYVVSNGVHTDIVLPVRSGNPDWIEFFKVTNLNPGIKHTPYIAFGWGSREFYIHTPEWKDLTPKTAMKALFLKGESALHVTLIDFTPEVGKSVKPVYLSSRQLDNLSLTIRSAFTTDTNGYPIEINAPGYYENDRFFAARGSFNIFRTCNVWTNECLKTTGIRCGIWTPFDFTVLYHLSCIKK